MASLDNEHVMASKVSVQPLNEGIDLKIVSGINGRVSNSGSQRFQKENGGCMITNIWKWCLRPSSLM